MFEYTYKNHIEFGYNGQLFNTRKRDSDTFSVNYSRCLQKPGTFKEELLRAARLVADKAKGTDLYVCLSGGIDSEITLLSFVEAGIPIKAKSVRFENNYNEHDLVYAVDICKKHGIDHEILDLNLESFLQHQLMDYAAPIACPSPQFPVVLWLIDQCKGFPVIGHGDCFITRIESTNDFNFIEKEKYFSYYHHLIRHEREGAPSFLQYTPELILSFLSDPLLNEYIEYRCREEKILSISKYKIKIYQQYFDLVDRPVYNGFEKIEELDLKYRKELETTLPVASGDYICSFQNFKKIFTLDD